MAKWIEAAKFAVKNKTKQCHVDTVSAKGKA